jgi:hypothetical protein
MSRKKKFETPTEFARRLYNRLSPDEQDLIGDVDTPLRPVVAPGRNRLIAAQIAKTHAHAACLPFGARTADPELLRR